MPSSTNTIVLAVLLSAARTSAQEWRQVEGAGPGSARCGLAYHEGRGELVRFGGEYVRDLPHQETRVFDGARWLLRPSINRPAAMPTARNTMPMTYDPVRDVVLLANDTNGNLWEWNGSSWTARPVSPRPPVGSGRAFAFDRARGVAVLSAGSSTWEWNGTAWRQASASAPTLEAAAFVPQRGTVIGVAGRDLYEWTGTAWVLVAGGILPPVISRVAAYDSWRSRLVIIDTIGLAMSVHEWDGTTLVTRTPAGGPPSPRFQPAATFDPSRGVTVLCGGEAAWLQSGCDDTWAWDGQGWRQLATVPPAGATWMAFDSTRGRLVATGAYHLMYWSWFTAGIWERDASGWRQLATSWPPRPGPIVFDPLRNQTVLVQPVDPAGPWLWSGTSWTTATVNPAPIGRDGAAMAFDLARGEAVLFGGTIGTTTWFNDTWLWNGSSWRQAAPTAFPGARYGHALAYDPIRQRTVLFGGTGPLVVAHSDTWEWDGQIWSPQTPAASPPPRIFHAMAFDASRSVVSVSGGTSPRLVIGSLVFTELPLDLWDWNGVAWQNTLIATAPMRRLHAMAFDGTRNRLVVQGGLAPESTVSTGLFSPMSPSSDTLELVRNGAAIRTSASPCSVSGPRLRAESLPFTGNASFALQLALADASSLAMLGLSVPGATPPLVFANGCRLHLGVPTVASFQITNPGGAARWAVGVAANPALRGIQLLAQGAAFDATLQPRTTELLVVTIGE